jgi:hypothetical protein
METIRTFGRSFWGQAAERALKTAGQAYLLAIAGDATNVLQLHVKEALSAIVGGAVLSLVTSIATAGVGQPDSPSVVKITPAA